MREAEAKIRLMQEKRIYKFFETEKSGREGKRDGFASKEKRRPSKKKKNRPI